ncbi:16S rRNA (guanine(527)-N(7))-methyltransferase RsmG [Sphingomonas turrisvirgatae]|uniref:Ribosomal RNA small subunit methyltransferase G n=1 Tax=Sphingomonas turrisvirgatae TaxID=1888892 RepID=A0A1E3LQD0_9SPHN|nr:16S rRNA (guanine(527)-N(7))-methyltransferase RsmG [Sphingomonas turrisvirgatae]ODP35972.1 16S rRNA (guanine(527)-N(7))-methyltransferase RsmG [Sphingomonas turrisvirgatae]
MTEEEARQWIIDSFGAPAEQRLAMLVDMLRTASVQQNLVAASTLGSIWARHIVDSAQLLQHGAESGLWLDIGSGAGLPGLVIAALRPEPIELVEPRRMRTEFMQAAAAQLGLTNVAIVTAKVERTTGHANVITARAVASLDQLFAGARHRANVGTLWILPKGRNANVEVEAACRSWHGTFHVKQSITAADSLIVVARGVAPR